MRHFLLALTLTACAHCPEAALHYPPSRTEPIVEQLFGTTVADPYRWLETASSDEVRGWMATQDQLTRAELAKLPGRDALAARLRQLYYVDSISPPHRRGTRFFYVRTHADREKAILYWREGEQSAEHVLIDPNLLSTDGSISLGVWVPSWDGRWLAYALRTNNSDEATLHLLEVATGEVSEIDNIPGAKYAHPSWTSTGDGFYYTRLPVDPTIPIADRPGYAEVRFHRLGTDAKHDLLVHERTGNPQTFVGAELSRDGHWLFFTIQHGWNATDLYFRDMRAGTRDFRPLAVGLPALFSIEAWQDRFYILTNHQAPRYRLYRADPAHPERAAWQDLVPESDGVLDGLGIVGGHLVLSYLRNAASALEVHTLDGKKVRDVPLPSIGTHTAMAGDPEEDIAFFSFASFTHTPTVYRTAISTGTTTEWAHVKVPIDPAPFTVEQVWYPSRDGTKVSMFLVHRRDLARDGKTPFLLGGYGGFNVSMTPSFAPWLYPWLEAGGGFALPNLRGGGEYGEAWHQAGMGARKQNVFDDFLAAADFLVEKGYTRAERLAIRGGSNGGLLVGAAITQAPEKFRAALCAVPLLDMVRYHRFGSGETWVPEYGSADDEAGFRTLLAYSPYHHVRRARYPAVLMMSADSDDRVDPMHARKMAAALQAQSQSGHPVLLRIERHAGHGGADLVKQAVQQSADALAFLMRELGISYR